MVNADGGEYTPSEIGAVRQLSTLEKYYEYLKFLLTWWQKTQTNKNNKLPVVIYRQYDWGPAPLDVKAATAIW